MSLKPDVVSLLQASHGILYGAAHEYGKTASAGGAEGTIFSIDARLPRLR
jgi:hypothetical protein